MTIYPTQIKVMATTAPEPVFVLNGMTYLPHYSKPCWMQPGAFTTTYNAMKKINEYAEDVSKRLSASELFAMGAKVEEQPLWPREWTRNWQQWLRP
jgi:hypothetical protein